MDFSDYALKCIHVCSSSQVKIRLNVIPAIVMVAVVPTAPCDPILRPDLFSLQLKLNYIWKRLGFVMDT